MNPREFLDVAFDLAGGYREAEWRSAISRGYYAAFHAAVALLTQCRFAVPPDESAHAYVKLRLSNCGHADVEKAGRDLDDLRQWRNRADYRLSISISQVNASNAVRRAEDILDQLELVMTLPHALAAITTAVRDYERNTLGNVTWTP